MTLRSQSLSSLLKRNHSGRNSSSSLGQSNRGPSRSVGGLRRKARSAYLRRDYFLDPRSYVTKGGRVRLFGQDKEDLRWAAYQRSKTGTQGWPLCECGCGKFALWTRAFVPISERGELAHNEHGARKSDELDRVKWMRHDCHMKSHNAGGKPCPRKPKIC